MIIAFLLIVVLVVGDFLSDYLKHRRHMARIEARKRSE